MDEFTQDILIPGYSGNNTEVRWVSHTGLSPAMVGYSKAVLLPHEFVTSRPDPDIALALSGCPGWYRSQQRSISAQELVLSLLPRSTFRNIDISNGLGFAVFARRY